MQYPALHRQYNDSPCMQWMSEPASWSGIIYDLTYFVLIEVYTNKWISDNIFRNIFGFSLTRLWGNCSSTILQHLIGNWRKNGQKGCRKTPKVTPSFGARNYVIRGMKNNDPSWCQKCQSKRPSALKREPVDAKREPKGAKTCRKEPPKELTRT